MNNKNFHTVYLKEKNDLSLIIMKLILAGYFFYYWIFLAGVKDNQTFGSLLVHDAMTTFSAADGIARLHFIIIMAF